MNSENVVAVRREIVEWLRGERDLIFCADEAYLLKTLCDLKLFSCYMSQFEQGNALPVSNVFRARRLFQKILLRQNAAVAFNLCNELEARGIEAVLLKGAGLSQTIYGSIFQRQYADIDILARSCDIPAVDAIFKENGLKQVSEHKQMITYKEFDDIDSGCNPGFPQKSRNRASQVYPYFAKLGKRVYRVELHDSFHYLDRASCDSIVDNRIRIPIAEIGELPVPSLEHQLMLLVANTYENSESPYSNLIGGKMSLQDYRDLNCFIQAFGANINPDKALASMESLSSDCDVRVVFDNARIIYPTWNLDISFGNKRVVDVSPSLWRLSILDRVFDSDACRLNALNVEKDLLARNANKQSISFVRCGDGTWVTGVQSVECQSSELPQWYSLAVRGNDFYVRWHIGEETRLYEKYSFCLGLLPQSREVDYLHICTFITYQNGEFIASAKKSNKPFVRPVFGGSACFVKPCIYEGGHSLERIVEVEINEFQHLLGSLVDEPVFVYASIFKKSSQGDYCCLSSSDEPVVAALPVKFSAPEDAL